MIFTCPDCGTTCSADIPPVNCCGVRHDSNSPAIREGELPPRKRRPKSSNKSSECIHRGDELRRVECASCGGNVQIKVLACEVHGECTMAKKVDGVKCCMGCADQATVIPLPKDRSVTIGVTTYMREESLQRCLDSIKMYAPDATVDVEDTGGNLSAGRNRLVARCKTQYFCLVEDDMQFTRKTKLEKLIDVVESDSELAGCGGVLIEPNPRNSWAHDFDPFRGELRAFPSRRDRRVSSGGIVYQPCQLICNFGVFRTDVLQSIKWDEDLELAEHREFFWRLSKQWLVGLTPDVEINHYSDRPDEKYSEERGRAKHFTRRAEQKIGLRLKSPSGSFAFTDPIPNIVVMGVGHSNTTITTKQLAALGWNLGDADDEYTESVSVRNVTMAEDFDHQRAKQALAQLPQPWVVKHPRLCSTMKRWLPHFAQYKPLLLWIQKDLSRVRQSYVTRGESPRHVERMYRQCEREFARWPWAKLSVRAEDVASAVAMFDVRQLAANYSIVRECPFCSSGLCYDCVSEHEGLFKIVCTICGTVGPGAFSQDEAFDLWNGRGERGTNEFG